MRRKTNISVQDNRGVRVTANLIVGEQYNGYTSGDILDANAIIALIKYFMQSGIPISGTVTSANIQDGSIQVEDLNDDLINRINNAGSATYDVESETIELNSKN